MCISEGIFLGGQNFFRISIRTKLVGGPDWKWWIWLTEGPNPNLAIPELQIDISQLSFGVGRSIGGAKWPQWSNYVRRIMVPDRFEPSFLNYGWFYTLRYMRLGKITKNHCYNQSIHPKVTSKSFEIDYLKCIFEHLLVHLSIFIQTLIDTNFGVMGW